MLHKKDLSRVREVFYCAAEDKPIERADIVKGYEYEKNRYVVVDTEELEKIAPPTATVMEILQFVRMNEIDPIFFETSYYVAPEESVSRPYSLLFEAMRETQYDALAKVTMHGPGAHCSFAAIRTGHCPAHDVLCRRVAEEESSQSACSIQDQAARQEGNGTGSPADRNAGWTVRAAKIPRRI
jgi:hypothetical protein